jgi:pyridoxal phosphate enzyme (YggS family)
MQLNHIKEKLKGATLVAVSKYQPDAAVMQLYDAGQRIFAESKAQDLERRKKTFPKDIEWHFIGHLQTNKIKQVLPCAALIHSIDSEKLLYAIDDFFKNKADFLQNIATIDVLLQVKIAQEDSKFGFTADDLELLLQKLKENPLIGVRIVGLMGMATNTESASEITSEFNRLNLLFKDLKQRFFAEKPYFKELSMGMSADFEIGVAQGSTMVRIGSLLFGD